LSYCRTEEMRHFAPNFVVLLCLLVACVVTLRAVASPNEGLLAMDNDGNLLIGSASSKAVFINNVNFGEKIKESLSKNFLTKPFCYLVKLEPCWVEL
jgi:hypothetical protein